MFKTELDKIFTCDYNLWLQRVHRVVRAYHANDISQENLPHYQRYITEFGQFNANYTLDELQRLEYPKSPFTVQKRHSYLRGAETWATEMLRELCLELLAPESASYPIFVDSHLFWGELQRYCAVIDAADFMSLTATTDYRALILDDPNLELWVCLSADTDVTQVKERIQRTVLEAALHAKVPPELHDIFLRKDNKISIEERKGLDDFLEQELLTCESESKKKQKLPERSFGWYGRVYGKLRGKNPTFLADNPSVINPETLQQFAEKYPDPFKTALGTVAEFIEKKREFRFDTNLYDKAVKDWIKSATKQRMSRVYYYSVLKDGFCKIETILFQEVSNTAHSDKWGPKTLISRLGYCVEPGRAVMAVLKHYPLLFVDEQQTRDFWRRLVKLPQFTSLPEDERQHIAQLADAIVSIPEDQPRRMPYKSDCDYFENRHCDGIYQFYHRLVVDYLFQFNKFNRPDSATFKVLSPELVDALLRFVKAYKYEDNKKLQFVIRAVQMITEIMRVDLTFSPFDAEHSLQHHIKAKLLHQHQVQSVALTPFGMRAYLRVLQASRLAVAGKHRAQIVATNQNYFEWLLNLDGIRQSEAKITRVRQLEDISRSADYIFMEIHPNNATERKLFPQHLTAFVDRMIREDWTEKQRTLVFDATLNDFKDPEMLEALTLAKPLINCGALNIVIVQSLTKFSQAGLDQRSGGINVTINNGKAWQQFNQHMQEIADAEPVEPSMVQYFSYFMQANNGLLQRNSFNVGYILMVNSKVNSLYDCIKEEFARLGLLDQKFLEMTVSADSRSCAIALNTHTILSYIDPYFSHSASELKKFTKDIVRKLFLPLCWQSGLPVTERMSIAFPMTNVNVISDCIRLTVGLEGILAYRKYAAIIAHIAYSLENAHDLNQLFTPQGNDIYPQREAFIRGVRQNFGRMGIARGESLQTPFNRTIYGPFHSERGLAYFLYQGNTITCIIGETIYKTESIAINQADIIIPCLHYSAAMIEYFIRSAGYIEQQGAKDCLMLYPKMRSAIIKQFVPLQKNAIRIFILENGIAIDRDDICVQRHGMTIFKHPFSADSTVIEMDYWQEKDSVTSRFLTFSLALYIKHQFGLDFKVRGKGKAPSTMFTHFLFKVRPQRAQAIFAEAWDVVYANRLALLDLLSQRVAEPLHPDAQPYRYCEGSLPAEGYDTSMFDGPLQFADGALVKNMMKILTRSLEGRLDYRQLVQRGFAVADALRERVGQDEIHEVDTDSPSQSRK